MSLPQIPLDGIVSEQILIGFDQLFHAGVSDIRIQSDDYIFAYQKRQWMRVSDRRMDDGEMRALVVDLYKSQSGLGTLGTGRPLDFEAFIQPYRDDPDKILRCRASVTASRVGNTREGLSIVLRTIPGLPMRWSDMGIEDEITEAFFPSQGLVLVVGITGSGKSTLIAGSIGHRIEVIKQPIAIITYEDPTEYIYPRLPNGNMPEVSQVQIGTQLETFSLVAPNVLRRKADVVLVGEMRDRASVETGLLVADTGHATYGTLHAETPASAFARVIAEFPIEGQASIANKLLENVRVVVAQKIERTIEGEAFAIRSWCVFDRELRSELGDCPHHMWARMIRQHMAKNRTTFEHRALPAIKAKKISFETFLRISSMYPGEARKFLAAEGVSV